MGENKRAKDHQRIDSLFQRRDIACREHRQVQAYFDQCRRRARQELLQGKLREDSVVLDLGCGQGDWLVDLQIEGVLPQCLVGIDRSPARIEEARHRLPGARLQVQEASCLTFDAHTFDGVILSLVLSSMNDQGLIEDVTRQAWRVLKPGGWLLVHELHRSKPGGDAAAFPFARLKKFLPPEAAYSDAKRLILLPPVARFFGPWAMGMVHMLERFPFLCGHWMARVDKEVL